MPASGGTEVKTIGDAVMLTIFDPAGAVHLGLRVTHERSAGRLTYGDTAYLFCSLACAAEFARQPERFAREQS